MVSHNDLYAIVMERTNNTCIIQQVAKYNETMLTLETASQGQVWYAQNKYDQYFIIIQWQIIITLRLGIALSARDSHASQGETEKVFSPKFS